MNQHEICSKVTTVTTANNKQSAIGRPKITIENREQKSMSNNTCEYSLGKKRFFTPLHHHVNVFTLN